VSRAPKTAKQVQFGFYHRLRPSLLVNRLLNVMGCASVGLRDRFVEASGSVVLWVLIESLAHPTSTGPQKMGIKTF